ncbi:MAG: glycosyltransferase [Candidatus Marinimicrobia bacterium]|nr:glycosyltransferase [Candidatus Neomarinimicrobiota bacterium]
MNVLHVVAKYPTEENPQSGSFIHSQIESLRNEGISCDVCVLDGSGINKYIHGIAHVRKSLKNGNYDIVHAHYAYTGWTARMATRLPLVVSYMGSDIYGNVNRKGKYTLRTRLLHKTSTYLLPRLSAFSIVKSSRMAREFSVITVDVIPNGVDFELFQPKDVSREELGLSVDKKYILFASYPDELFRRNEKRFDIAEEAVNKLKEIMPEAELLWIRKKPADEVAKYLNAVDCLLLTSEHEGSPNIVKEAIACNLPVISRDVGDVSERIEGVRNCYIVSNKPEEIADILHIALKNNQRALNGYEQMQDLSQQKIARKIIAVYEDMLI